MEKRANNYCKITLFHGRTGHAGIRYAGPIRRGQLRGVQSKWAHFKKLYMHSLNPGKAAVRSSFLRGQEGSLVNIGQVASTSLCFKQARGSGWNRFSRHVKGSAEEGWAIHPPYWSPSRAKTAKRPSLGARSVNLSPRKWRNQHGVASRRRGRGYSPRRRCFLFTVSVSGKAVSVPDASWAFMPFFRICW